MPRVRQTQSKAPPPEGGRAPSGSWRGFAAGAALGLAILAAYHNSLEGPFVFDDIPSIVENASIRRLWPVGDVLAPPAVRGLTVAGRPLVNLSLAVNHALGGYAVRGYHVFNLLVHVLAGLTLFGVARRTFARPVLAARFGAAAPPLGLAVAALWALHPLQTEPVDFVIQRAEAMMGLCYLLALYGLIRSVDSPHRRRWQAASIAACLVGAGCKEVIVTAPAVLLLYDRTFLAGTFRGAWQDRRWYYAGLAATWLPLAWLVRSTGGDRGGMFDLTPSAFPEFWLTQFEAVTRYLQLSLWPHPLVFDYGFFKVNGAAEVVPYALAVLPLLGVTLWALRRKPVAGFLGAAFFLILAPSSLMPNTVQVILEHRMYLPLAAILALGVAGLYRWAGRRSGIVFSALAIGGGVATFARNQDYRSDLALWADTVAKRPRHAMARVSLGNALAARGQVAQAVEEYGEATRLASGNPTLQARIQVALGNAYGAAGRWPEAIAGFERALELQPDDADAHNNLGATLMNAGRAAGSLAHFAEAVRLRPDFARAELNWGSALILSGRAGEAVPHLARAVALQPDFAEAELNWGIALNVSGRFSEAVAHFERALQLRPGFLAAHNSYGQALAGAGRLEEAVAQYRQALAIAPGIAEIHRSLAEALRRLGRTDESEEHRREARRLEAGSRPR